MQQDKQVLCKTVESLNSSGNFRVLVGVTGSVAALKLPALVDQLLQLPGVDVRVVTTEHAKHFYNHAEVAVKIYSDKDEWELWKQRTDPVLHIELRRWADLLVIAPLDANTLGKISNGICDNLLTCVVRAWDTSRPLLFCPAMNTAMWLHPITAQQISRLKEFGYMEVPCISKKLVCGDEGLHNFPQTVAVPKDHLSVLPFNQEAPKMPQKVQTGKGAMAEVSTIISVVEQHLHKSKEKPEESQ
uniref:Phosphopantothenoylcysteine decarboxylase n=1 Tax=Oryzias sinensis TaxID=183150 RepID=A0A8C7ZW44_9TELE